MLTRRGLFGMLIAGLVAPWEGIRRALRPKTPPFVPLAWIHFADGSSRLGKSFPVIRGGNRSGATNFAAAEFVEMFCKEDRVMEANIGLRDLMYGEEHDVKA